MAKVKGPLFSLDGKGKLGEGICFTGSMGGARVILNPTHRDAKSSSQSIQRTSFLTARSMWKALSPASKAYYETLAKDLAMTGYNFYVKQVLLGLIGQPVWVEGSFEAQISHAWNDCYVYYSVDHWSFDRLESIFVIGHPTSTWLKTGGGFYYPNSTIPYAATILTAHLHFMAEGSQDSTPVKARIVGDLEANPAQWTNLADYQARRGTDVGGADNTKRTIAEPQWSLPATITDLEWYETCDFAPVMQEIVNQAGYAAGHAVAVFVDDHKNETPVNEGYNLYAANSGFAKAAKLHVTYKYLA